MSSLLTNNAAMSALQSLTMTQKSLNTTQNQISSGLRVASASDNAAYWSISTTMKSDTSALSAVTDALNLGSSVVGVATTALSSTLTIMNKMKADLVTAQTPGTNTDQVQSDIASLQGQLKAIAGSASFNGVNLLSGASTGTGTAAVASTQKIVASFSRDASGTAKIGTIDINTTSTLLVDSSTAGNVGILSKGGTDSTTDSILTFNLSTLKTTAAAGTSTTAFANDLTALSADIDKAITAITSSASTLGATQTSINTQSAFVSSLSDAITSGVGSLVDADMNVASTRLQALQTQQQLGIQSLSIANQNSQLILKLFGG